MGKESEADEAKLPYWDDLDMEGFKVDSHIHDLPYDSGILLENLMDPAHIPISHDKSVHPHSGIKIPFFLLIQTLYVQVSSF